MRLSFAMVVWDVASVIARWFCALLWRISGDWRYCFMDGSVKWIWCWFGLNSFSGGGLVGIGGVVAMRVSGHMVRMDRGLERHFLTSIPVSEMVTSSASSSMYRVRVEYASHWTIFEMSWMFSVGGTSSAGEFCSSDEPGSSSDKPGVIYRMALNDQELLALR